MNERVLKSLFDIKIAINEIESFLPSEKLTYNDYKSNLLLKRAIERNLEIIGEAMNRIIKEDPDFPIKEAYRIVGLRNQIIHAYDSISDENIWAIIINHLPSLKVEIDQLTQEFE
jgi:uncharacterized protein with HEPN domain